MFKSHKRNSYHSVTLQWKVYWWHHPKVLARVSEQNYTNEYIALLSTMLFKLQPLTGEANGALLRSCFSQTPFGLTQHVGHISTNPLALWAGRRDRLQTGRLNSICRPCFKQPNIAVGGTIKGFFCIRNVHTQPKCFYWQENKFKSQVLII